MTRRKPAHQSWPGKPEDFPTTLAPMLAQQGESPFRHDDWTFEPKLDGYRIQIQLSGGRVRLLTRGGLDITDDFPFIASALCSQTVKSLVIDGELVGFGEDGKPSFSALQGRRRRMAAMNNDAALFCFDILHIEGCNLRNERQADRRRILERALVTSDRIQLVHADDDGPALFEVAKEAGMEGIIAKLKSSPYRPGVRSADWIKILAFKRADMIILGYAGTTVVESLMVGYRRAGQLRYAATVTGLGQLAKSLLPVLQSVPDGSPCTRARGVRWVAPMLVAEIRYRELTKDGKLRHPTFYRMRTDIAPSEGDFPDYLA